MALSNSRQDLVAAYHILGHLGLDDHTYTHLSLRAGRDAFYIYQFGLRFSEVTVDNLLTVSCSGQVLAGDEANYNRTGFIIHGNILQDRPDINAIFHIHTPAIVAVASCKEGLLPLSQWALHFYERLAYHEYGSLTLTAQHGAQIVADLSDKFVILMRNHGALICGRTIQEAMFYTYHLERACQTQCLLQKNRELVMPSVEVCRQAVHDLLTFEENLGERDWQAWVRFLRTR